MCELRDKVTPIWLIVYDQDPSKAYTFTSKEKVVASVEGALRSSNTGDNPDIDVICEEVLLKLDEAWGMSFILMRMFDIELFIHRLDIDRHNAVGKILMDAHDALDGVDDELAGRIDDLFIDPTVLMSSG